MKLLFSPNPQYIHKVLVVAHETGLLNRLDLENAAPFDQETTIWEYNPLGKVPCLILDNGKSLFGGLLICEYLDSLSIADHQMFPKGDNRWSALRQATLGEGMFDAISGLPGRTPDYRLRERKRILNCLDSMEKEAPNLSKTQFHIGHVCVASALSYLSFRKPLQEHAMVEGDVHFDWRGGRRSLSDWYDSLQGRPSIIYKAVV